MSERARSARSIRRRLLYFLVPSLLLLVVGGAVLSYGVALHIAVAAYDRSLLDPALDMAENVRQGANGPRLDMLAQAQEALLFDSDDKVFFQIRDAQGAVIAGSPELAPPPPMNVGEPQFFDGKHADTPLRIAALRVKDGFTVQVGETLNKRKRIVREIIAAELLPTAIIALAALGLAWTVVVRGVAPLSKVRSEILSRSPNDLRPLDVREVPVEIAPAINAFNHLLAQLRGSSAVQQRFFANAAHQLRTPLAALQMHVDLLLHSELPNNLRREIEPMQASAARATRLANQLLVLARAEAYADRSRPMVPVNLQGIANGAVQEWVPRAIARDIDLGFELADAPIVGDATLIAEVLNNLIDNALRYTPSGGSVTVRCGVGSEGPYLSVEDTGPGIPESVHERVFERFFRVQGTPGDGAGLGLAIVKEVAEQHAAAIKLETSRTSGTRIMLVFPAAPQTQTSTEVVSQARTATHPREPQTQRSEAPSS
jgi:two-component system sensor histidine kinase TctE